MPPGPWGKWAAFRPSRSSRRSSPRLTTRTRAPSGTPSATAVLLAGLVPVLDLRQPLLGAPGRCRFGVREAPEAAEQPQAREPREEADVIDDPAELAEALRVPRRTDDRRDERAQLAEAGGYALARRVGIVGHRRDRRVRKP